MNYLITIVRFGWLGLFFFGNTAFCQSQIKKYYALDSTQVMYTQDELNLKLPEFLKPVMDYPIRDVSICKGPDDLYYMTGTTGDPDMWAVTGDIKIWKSADLHHWLPVITKPRKRSTVWNADRDGTWERKIQLRDGAPFRPLWAPEIQYFNHTFWLTYCLPRLGSGILKSTSGKAEGPYEKTLATDAPFNEDIDPALFKDDDGKTYFVSGEGKINPLKDDLSGASGAAVLAVPANAKHVGFEGAFLFKRNGIYYMSCAEFVNGDYHCFVASSTHIYGPYSNRYLVIPHGGHNTFFKDKTGQWWATFFGNDKNAPFRDRPALIKVEFDQNNKIILVNDQPPLPGALAALNTPVIFKGDKNTAYRDPAIVYAKSQFYLFFTLSKTEKDDKVYTYTAMSTSADLKKWSAVKILTPKDQNLDYSSPGNVIRYKNEWIICLQTYPRPGYLSAQMPKYGTADSRLYIMRSKDLENWSKPELIKVKGDSVSFAAMGRMIDPYLIEDKDEKGKWWCFYKQNGVSKSYSYDLQHWVYAGHAAAGENVCVLVKDNQYVLFHSPENGIGMKTSKDLVTWDDVGPVMTLGQSNWDWAKGRISAGAVVDLTKNPLFENYIMFFHGSGPLTEKEGDFDKNASIGIAWSADLNDWYWPKDK